MLADEAALLIPIEIGYRPGASEAKVRGAVKLTWKSPAATSAVALAGS